MSLVHGSRAREHAILLTISISWLTRRKKMKAQTNTQPSKEMEGMYLRKSTVAFDNAMYD
jgi:hypothetical protein